MGVGADAPESRLHVAGVTPDLRLRNDATPANDGLIRNVDARLEVEKHRNSGNAIIDPLPQDGTGDARVRIFRDTNTSGPRAVQVYRGDGSAAVSAEISADGANRFVQAHGGNFGVGTTAPNTPFALTGNGGNANVGITQNQLGGTKSMELTTADGAAAQASRLMLGGGSNGGGVEFYRGANGVEELTLKIAGSTGNVGIDTASPTHPLTINDAGDAALKIAMKVQNPFDTPGTGIGIHFGTNVDAGGVTSKGAIVYEYTAADGKGSFHILQESGGGVPELADAVMTVTNDGLVGIGTSNPGNALQVGDGTTEAGIEIPNGGLCVDTDGVCAPTAGALTVGPAGILGTNSAGNDVLLVPDASGNVAIGTTAPTHALTINKAGDATLKIAMKVQNPFDTPGTGIGIHFGTNADAGGVTSKGALVYENTAPDGKGSFHFLQESGNGVPELADAAMTITNQGYVGIGRTDPLAPLHGQFAEDDGVILRNTVGNCLAATSDDTTAIEATSLTTTGTAYGISALQFAEEGAAVYGRTLAGVEGATASGVLGRSFSERGHGVEGVSEFTGAFGAGVFGTSSTSLASVGVWGEADGGFSFGVYGVNDSPGGDGYAGVFFGDVDVTDWLSKGGGSFKIDHPLDPENKYLMHSFVESPDMMNVYNGNVTTDAMGYATVTMPDWFDTLNRDFRYQLTVIGDFAQAVVSKELENNEFVIRTDKPGVRVSWQITGVRQDPFANARRLQVEVDKPEFLKGRYQHPTAYGQPKDKTTDVRQLYKLDRKAATELMDSMLKDKGIRKGVTK